jgi:hypothetical protein
MSGPWDMVFGTGRQDDCEAGNLAERQVRVLGSLSLPRIARLSILIVAKLVRNPRTIRADQSTLSA